MSLFCRLFRPAVAKSVVLRHRLVMHSLAGAHVRRCGECAAALAQLGALAGDAEVVLAGEADGLTRALWARVDSGVLPSGSAMALRRPRHRAGPTHPTLAWAPLLLVAAIAIGARGPLRRLLHKRHTQIAHKSHPQEAISDVDRADLYWEKSDRKSAVAGYTEALRLDPTYAAAYLGRARVYRELHRTEAARADLRSVIALSADPAAIEKARAELRKDRPGAISAP